MHANESSGFGDLDTEQPFGYRNIYQTPSSSLYRALQKSKIPAVTEHYDFQLWDENATDQLKTVRPWEEQPLPLSAYFGPEHFFLQPPASSPSPGESRQNPGGTGNKRPGKKDKSRREPAKHMPGHPLAPMVPEGLRARIQFQTVTNIERGMKLRAYSYANPLDVQTNRDVPINAPPVDTLLNLRRDSLPVVSLSVLTPTEVRRLQKDYNAMRNLLLSRTQQCPYVGCNAAYPVNQPIAMQLHLYDTHVAERCHFCDEALFQHWPAEQRFQHYVRKHSEILRSLETSQRDKEVEVASEARVMRAREGRWKFCARCGRDHTVLNARADRTHHDNVCYPGVQDREIDWSACGACGDRIPKPAQGSDTSERHVHTGIRQDGPFCKACALPLGRFTEAYREKHSSFCKGHGRDDARHCPWCGVQLDWQLDSRLEHIEKCHWKPSDDAEGPIDIKSKSYFRSSTIEQPSGTSKAPEASKEARPAPEAESEPEPEPEPEPAAAAVPKKSTARKLAALHSVLSPSSQQYANHLPQTEENRRRSRSHLQTSRRAPYPPQRAYSQAVRHKRCVIGALLASEHAARANVNTAAIPSGKGPSQAQTESSSSSGRSVSSSVQESHAGEVEQAQARCRCGRGRRGGGDGRRTHGQGGEGRGSRCCREAGWVCGAAGERGVAAEEDRKPGVCFQEGLESLQ